MTRKAGTITQDTKNRLMDVATYEFATKGFFHSSLRDICQKAGLSTGALYFFFESKDDLFNEIVSSVTKPLTDLMTRHFEEEITISGTPLPSKEDRGSEDFQNFLHFYYQNKNACDVLLYNRTHPCVEAFFNDVTSLYEEHYLTLIESIAKVKGRKAPLDEYAVRWFARTDMEMTVDLLVEGFSEDDAIAHAKNLIKIMEKGFEGLL